jgi:predicted AAA+ superfamily ATPase
MNFYQRLEELLGIKIVSQEILKATCNSLELNIGFENVREHLIENLNEVAKNENTKLLFVFLGQQGLGKTIVARDVLKDFLYCINRTQRQAFLKIEPYQLDKTTFETSLNLKIIEGKGGVIFIDEVHNLREVEQSFFDLLVPIVQSEEYQRTSFVVSSGAPSWKKIKEKFPELSTLSTHEIYFEPYTDEQLAEILREAIYNDGNTIQVPHPSLLISLVRELRFIRKRQNQYFENASEVQFFYNKCLKKAAIYQQNNVLDEELRHSSLKEFSRTLIRR